MKYEGKAKHMRYEEFVIEGRNAVMKLLEQKDSVDRLFILEGHGDGPIRTIIREAKKGVPLLTLLKKKG